MIDFHLIAFFDHQSLGLSTKIVSLVVWFQSYAMFNICSLIMLIDAN